MAENPLNSRYRPGATPEHPAKRHAEAWKHVNGMDLGTIKEKSDRIDGLLPMLGALAGNPNVKAKDVIKAAADAAGQGMTSPSEAVQFISSMPSEPDKLQGWLKNIYATNMAAQVHMKAAMMKANQPPVPVQAPAAAPPPSSMTLQAAP